MWKKVNVLKRKTFTKQEGECDMLIVTKYVVDKDTA